MAARAILGAVLAAVTLSAHAALDWTALPPLPDREGFAGSYAGVVDGALFVAGGANFPDRRPWEGGAKVWYDRVFLLEPGATAWREATRLPRAAGYGVSVTLDEGVLLIGGGDAPRNFSSVWLVQRVAGGLTYTAWPELPRAVAMGAGARVGRKIYVAGGLERPDATRALGTFLCLDLDDRRAGWRELPTWPGPERMLAVAGAAGGEFFLFSGASLAADAAGKPVRTWLQDAYRYSPARGWTRLADLPRVALAAPTPAPWVGGKLLVLGGDDGRQAGVAPTAHAGFPRAVLALDPATGTWNAGGELPFSLVTTPLAEWSGRIIVPGGEQRPGVRSPAVWTGEMR